jgi:LPS export ABC transporter protein LptC
MKRLRLCALVLSAVAFIGCEEKLRPSIVTLNQSQLPSQESWNSTVTFTDSAKIKAVLWAGYIAVYATEQHTLLGDSVRVDFYDESEQHSSLLTAKRGRVNDRTQDLEAYDNVRLLSDSGTVLKTERLFWDNGTQTIRSDAFVEIISPSEHITGHGMVSDQALKNYKIFRVAGRAVTRE